METYLRHCAVPGIIAGTPSPAKAPSLATLTIFRTPVTTGLYGTVTVASSTQIRIVAGSVTQNYYGTGFTYSPYGQVTGGILQGTDFSDSANGGLQYQITGLNASAVTAYGYVATGNSQGLTQYLLSGNDVINGSSGSDVLAGYAGMDALSGGAGNDHLDGSGDGAVDTLTGGLGDDVYRVDGGTSPGTQDVLVEAAGQGLDTVESLGSFTLPDHFENLLLVGLTEANGTGNALANTLTGHAGRNLLEGRAGDDTLDGAGGADTLQGGNGDDLYLVNTPGVTLVELPGEGVDRVWSSVSLVLPAGVEHLRLLGDAALNGMGNADANLIEGNAAANVLDGGAGNDTLQGGLGDDTYMVDSPLDVVIDTGGDDTVQVTVSGFVLNGADIENLSLAGSALTGSGNDAANRITGNALANVLDGRGGHDTLDGGAGADTLNGGSGDDLFLLDDAGDRVVELIGDGTDTVLAMVDYTLAANVEHLTLRGSQGLHGTGNAVANGITGTAFDDMLDGGAGADTLTGGEGADRYVVDNAGDRVVENGVFGTDWIFSSVNFDLATTSGVENLTLTGAANLSASGNALMNVITGNDGNNVLTSVQGDTLVGGAGNDTLKGSFSSDVLDGGAGADTMAGDTGYDTYTVDHPGDVVIEVPVNTSDRYDLVKSWISYTLPAYVEWLTLQGDAPLNGTGTGAGNEILTGNSAANVLASGGGMNDDLYGMGGDDTLRDDGGYARMYGGAGDDTYVITGSLGWIVEDAGEGVDTVQVSFSFTLPAHVENLTLVAGLSATGNTLDNVLIGNAGTNFLDGGAGADTLQGGLGDDQYYVDNAGDVVIEEADAGLDGVVCSGVSFSLVGTGVERLYLDSGGSSVAHTHGTGNALDNLIRGTNGDNLLDGGAGADDLTGYLGNDTYVVDNAGDTVTEFSGQGTDTVRSHLAAYTLGTHFENLVLATGAIQGTGNSAANLLNGNAAHNTLDGAGGNDTLIGGAGVDTAVYAGLQSAYTVTRGPGSITVSSAEGVDTLTGIDVLHFADGDVVLNAHQPAGGVSLGGTPVRGQTLSAVTGGLSDADGLGALTYQWLRGEELIAGATAASYQLTLADVGMAIILRASYVDGSGTTETVESVATAPIDIGDITAPMVTAFVPADAATAVPVGSDITVTFSEAIERGNGTIVLKTAAGATVATFSPGSPELTVSGTTLTIHPPADLAHGTRYVLEIAPGALQDLAGNAFAGTTRYAFTTAGVTGGLTGTNADDQLQGTAGNDTLTPGLGHDTVNAGAGVDTVVLPLFPNVYRLTESSPGHVSGSYAAATLHLNDVELVQFGRAPIPEDAERFQTTIALSQLVSGEAQLQLGRLTDLYLAFFGRAPDVSGLEYWQEKLLEEGRDFATISKDFAWSKEAQALFPPAASNREFVRTVYLNCFGREPDQGGWDFWTGKLDGLTDLNDRGAFVGEVILGAYASTSGEEDRSLLTNRHEAAMYYVNKLAADPAEGFDAAINTLLARVTGVTVTEDKAEDVINYAFANPVTLAGIMTDQPLLDSIWGA